MKYSIPFSILLLLTFGVSVSFQQTWNCPVASKAYPFYPTSSEALNPGDHELLTLDVLLSSNEILMCGTAKANSFMNSEGVDLGYVFLVDEYCKLLFDYIFQQGLCGTYGRDQQSSSLKLFAPLMMEET